MDKRHRRSKTTVDVFEEKTSPTSNFQTSEGLKEMKREPEMMVSEDNFMK